MKLEVSRYGFEKYSNIKFHENLSNGIRVRADGGIEDYMTKFVVAFRSFANAIKKRQRKVCSRSAATDKRVYPPPSPPPPQSFTSSWPYWTSEVIRLGPVHRYKVQ